MKTQKSESVELTYMQKKTKPFIEEIYQDYIKNGGMEDEAIKSYIHVFVTTIYRSIKAFKNNINSYEEVFNNLFTMDKEDFYKMAFEKFNDEASGIEYCSLPCCILKDFYDDDILSTIESKGGQARQILDQVYNEEETKTNDDLTPTAKKWGIDEEAVLDITDDGIRSVIDRLLGFRLIEPLNHQTNPEILHQTLMEHFPQIKDKFAIEFDLVNPLDKQVVQSWREKVRKVRFEDEKLNSEEQKTEKSWAKRMNSGQNSNRSTTIE